MTLKLKLLIVAVLFAGMAAAQVSSSTARRIVRGATLPVTCQTSDVFYLTTAGNAGPYQCSNGVWAVMGSTGNTGPAGPVGPAGPAGGDGAPGVPGYSPSALTSGGSVVWTTGLTFVVSATSYQIGGTNYAAPQTTLTLAAADPTNPRFDAVVVNTSSVAVVVKGTAAATPARPDIDPSTQLLLTFIYVAATATTPSNVTSTLIYDENAGPATEWSCTAVGTPLNLASTTTPYSGTKDLEAIAAVAGNNAQCTAASPFTLTPYNYLIFYVRSKAVWGSKRSIQIQFKLTATGAAGSIVTLNEGAFGFNSSSVAAYQQIAVPLSLFSTIASLDGVKFTMAGTGGTMGFFIDKISLQAGLPSPSASTALVSKGAWTAAPAYAVNDVVTYSYGTWAAIASNTNSAPTCSNINWFSLTPAVCNGPYSAPVSALATLTVTAVTHKQGTLAIASCFDNSTPAVAVSCAYTRAANGDIAFSWSPNFTGTVEIRSGNGSGVGAIVPTVTFWHNSSNGHALQAPLTAGDSRGAWFYLPISVTTGGILIDVATADATGCGTNCYAFAIYNASGVCVAHTAKLPLSALGVQSFDWVEGTVTIPAGEYTFAWSASTLGNVARLQASTYYTEYAKFGNAGLGGNADGSALASIAWPATSWQATYMITFALR